MTTVFFNFGGKETENLSSKNGHFLTISCHFLAATQAESHPCSVLVESYTVKNRVKQIVLKKIYLPIPVE